MGLTITFLFVVRLCVRFIDLFNDCIAFDSSVSQLTLLAFERNITLL